jgi:hypothetical protein
MLLDDPELPPDATGVAATPGAAFYLSLLAALLVAGGVFWNPLVRAAERAASVLLLSAG